MLALHAAARNTKAAPSGHGRTMIGIKPLSCHYGHNEMAHYASDCLDAGIGMAHVRSSIMKSVVG
jgi:hypothetical protein